MTVKALAISLILLAVKKAASQVALVVNPSTQFVEVVTDVPPTVSVLWDRVVQQLVVETGIGPTLASDAYGKMHTAMYDTWAVIDRTSKPTCLNETQAYAGRVSDGRIRKAMSYAATFVLREVFPDHKESIDEIRKSVVPPRRLQEEEVEEEEITKLKAMGRLAAQCVMEKYTTSNQTDENESPFRDGTSVVDQWQEEHIPIDDENGPIQDYLTPFHGRLLTFGPENGASFRPPPPQPFLLEDGDVDFDAKTITLSDGTVLDITKDIIGTAINPKFIEQAEEVVEFSRTLTDEGKLIAEFWEDGGGTSFPPGTWMTIGQFVSARDGNSVGTDAKMFMALSNAVRDAGILTWNAKLYYYYSRPVRAIRQLGELGLIGTFDESMGGNVITAYNMATGQVENMLAANFVTYQTPGSHPSPPFPEYTSGHSAFSASAAEVLRIFTGSDVFGGSITIRAGESRFEPGTTPAEDLTLSWETFSDAAIEAGLSRLYGGIHFDEGNVFGSDLGRSVGEAVMSKVVNLEILNPDDGDGDEDCTEEEASQFFDNKKEKLRDCAAIRNKVKNFLKYCSDRTTAMDECRISCGVCEGTLI